MKNSHGVGDVDNSVVLGNFGNKVAVDQIIRHGHADSENHAVRVALEHRLHVTLGLTVEGSIKVGEILLSETNAGSQRMGFVVLEDATGSIDSNVNITEHAQVSNVQGSNDVGTNGVGLVVLAPVNVRTTGDTSSHEGMRRLDLVELLSDSFAFLYPSIGEMDLDISYTYGGGRSVSNQDHATLSGRTRKQTSRSR
jgi:hypothetical protein